jgi:hypothetical protein
MITHRHIVNLIARHPQFLHCFWIGCSVLWVVGALRRHEMTTIVMWSALGGFYLRALLDFPLNRQREHLLLGCRRLISKIMRLQRKGELRR